MTGPTPGEAPLAPASGGKARRITRSRMWPSRGSARQIERLRRAIGQPVYIVELTFNGLAVGAVYHSEPRALLRRLLGKPAPRLIGRNPRQP